MKFTNKTSNLLALLIVIIILGISLDVKGQVTSTNISTVKARTVKPNNSNKVNLVFKVKGMKSENDAQLIDDFLKTKSFVIASSTDFKTGLCKVETGMAENDKLIIEAIRYNGKKIQSKITAELAERSNK